MSRPLPRVLLKTGRQRSLIRRHPWVFSGAIASVEGQPTSGETVAICDADGRPLAHGAYSPRSQIRVRVWTFEPDQAMDQTLLRLRLQHAVARRALLTKETNAMRLVNAESDGIPGLIVDRYNTYLVCQILSAGPERWRDTLVELLQQLVPDAQGIYERSDAAVRTKEGLEQRTGLISGNEPPELVEIFEGNRRFLVDLHHGHKTGFYLDQRESRSRLGCHVTRDADVLNAFAYTGGFAVAALAAGARHVINIDSSGPALSLSRRNLELNGPGDEVEQLEDDVFTALRRFRDSRRSFDLIVLDPPRFVDSRAQLDRGSRGYKDINLLAFKLLRPGGRLLTFSCSGLMEPALFQKIVADAALDARREAQIIERLGQPEDHPVALSFPEGRYLKGLVCRVE